MHIVTVLGSPKKMGKTATVLQEIEDASIERGDTVERINLIDRTINVCMECFACTLEEEKPGCAQKDDAQALFEKLLTADEIVYASPVIGWDVSALMKPFMDRHFCLVKGYGSSDHVSFVEGKGISLLLTCMGPREGNADLAEAIFDRFGRYTKAAGSRTFVVPKSGEPDFPERAKQPAYEMLASLVRQ